MAGEVREQQAWGVGMNHCCFSASKASGLTVKLIRRYKNTFLCMECREARWKPLVGQKAKSLQTAFSEPWFCSALPVQNLLSLSTPLDSSVIMRFKWTAHFSILASGCEQELVSKLRVNGDFCIGTYAGSHYSALIKMALAAPLGLTKASEGLLPEFRAPDLPFLRPFTLKKTCTINAEFFLCSHNVDKSSLSLLPVL